MVSDQKRELLLDNVVPLQWSLHSWVKWPGFFYRWHLAFASWFALSSTQPSRSWRFAFGRHALTSESVVSPLSQNWIIVCHLVTIFHSPFAIPWSFLNSSRWTVFFFQHLAIVDWFGTSCWFTRAKRGWWLAASIVHLSQASCSTTGRSSWTGKCLFWTWWKNHDKFRDTCTRNYY